MRSEARAPTVLLTRQEQDTILLRAALEAKGVDVLSLPCLRVEPVADSSELRQALRALEPGDWLVMTSRYAVDAVVRAVPANAIRARVAVAGPASAQRAREAGFVPWQPDQADAVGIARGLAPSGKVLWPRTDIADGALARDLRARGFEVLEVVAYRTLPGIDGDPTAVRRGLERSAIDAVAFFSPSAVDGLLTAVPAELVARTALVASGRTTAAHVRARLDRDPLVAEEISIAGMARVIERALEVAHAHA